MILEKHTALWNDPLSVSMHGGRKQVKFSNPPSGKMSRFLSTGKHSNISFPDSKSQPAIFFFPSFLLND
jgi:hypothetical protein